MIHDEWLVNRSMKATPQDIETFHKWTDYLPRRMETTPFHSGPHSIQNIYSAMKLASYQWGNGHEFGPHAGLNILETGFCLGHSATMFLELGAMSVVSIDNSLRLQTTQGAARVKDKYKDRFEFIRGDARQWGEPIMLHLRGRYFDFMFIDGGHEFEDVEADFLLGQRLGIKRFLFDDFYPHWGPGVQPVIQKYDLLPVAILGTMAFCYKP